MNVLLGTKYPDTKWTILSEAPRKRYSRGSCLVAWNVRCDCGAESVVASTALQTGRSKQCRKCSSKQASQHSAKALFKHGHNPSPSNGRKMSPTYGSWYSMKQRCSNPKNKRYVDYAGRGIKVCERWMSFENFLADMGVRPDDMTLDRINVNGNYEPSNCRWADAQTQALNKRKLRVIDKYTDDEVRLEYERRELHKRSEDRSPLSYVSC